VFDPALTRPWTVDKKYVRDPAPRPDWVEHYCTEGASMVAVGKDAYLRAAGSGTFDTRSTRKALYNGAISPGVLFGALPLTNSDKNFNINVL
jgi:hypothetical protein